MHYRICCATITVYQSGFYERISSNKFLSRSIICQKLVNTSSLDFISLNHGRMQDLPRGANFLGACDAARSQAFTSGVRGHASPNFF